MPPAPVGAGAGASVRCFPLETESRRTVRFADDEVTRNLRGMNELDFTGWNRADRDRHQHRVERVTVRTGEDGLGVLGSMHRIVGARFVHGDPPSTCIASTHWR